MEFSSCVKSLLTDKSDSSKGIVLQPTFLDNGQYCHWIRPLGYVEKFMTHAGSWGNMTTAYAVWFDSTRPIPFSAVKNVSQWMFKKMPHLKLCIGRHNNDLWWREMDEEKLDIEELETEDVQNLFEVLLTKRYNVKKGPLWFVRFLKSLNRNDLVSDKDFGYKHQSVCIFGFNHNISDGKTNMDFCNIFVSLLNNVLEEKSFDTKMEGHFAAPIHDLISKSTFSYLEMLYIFTVRFYKIWIVHSKYVNNFLNHYPSDPSHSGRTLVLQKELNEISTQKLLKRCRMEKVTLNSVFSAAANVAMFKMILKKDNSVQCTRFDSHQAVNMRRYWPKEAREKAYGCHISTIDIEVPTTRQDIQEFWEYSRKVHSAIYQELNVNKTTLRNQVLSEKLWLTIFFNSFWSKIRMTSGNDYHYCLTNMGDVTSTFSENNSVVNVSRILRSVSSHFLSTLCQHTIQTFRGKLYYFINYYPQKISKETADAYSDCILSTLEKAIHMPN